MLATVTSDPWMPVEEMQMKGRLSRVGYVLSENESEFEFLLDDNREIVRIPVEDVQDRSMCIKEEALFRLDRMLLPLPMWFSDKSLARYSICPVHL
ncbi:hypothetical protein GCM10027569_69580 [Flindersiella endophytica]